MLKSEASIHLKTPEENTSQITRKHESPFPAIASGIAINSLAIRRRMAEELVERGLSKQAAARLLRLEPE